MAKNNNLINAMKAYRKQFDLMIPKIYAAFCIALHEEGFGFTRLSRVLVRSQQLWEHEEDISGTGEWICAECKRLTGVDVKYGLNSTSDKGWRE